MPGHVLGVGRVDGAMGRELPGAILVAALVVEGDAALPEPRHRLGEQCSQFVEPVYRLSHSTVHEVGDGTIEDRLRRVGNGLSRRPLQEQ